MSSSLPSKLKSRKEEARDQLPNKDDNHLTPHGWNCLHEGGHHKQKVHINLEIKGWSEALLSQGGSIEAELIFNKL